MLRIRHACLEDLDSLAGLLAALFAIEADFVFDEVRQRKGLSLMIRNQNGCLLVAEEAGRVVGMCSGQVLISTAEGGPALLVEDVVVRDDRRGKGVGRALIQAIHDWAAKRKIQRLQLLADRGNRPALAFYEKLDWQPTRLVCLRRHCAPGGKEESL